MQDHLRHSFVCIALCLGSLDLVVIQFIGAVPLLPTALLTTAVADCAAIAGCARHDGVTGRGGGVHGGSGAAPAGI